MVICPVLRFQPTFCVFGLREWILDQLCSTVTHTTLITGHQNAADNTFSILPLFSSEGARNRLRTWIPPYVLSDRRRWNFPRQRTGGAEHLLSSCTPGFSEDATAGLPRGVGLANCFISALVCSRLSAMLLSPFIGISPYPVHNNTGPWAPRPLKKIHYQHHPDHRDVRHTTIRRNFALVGALFCLFYLVKNEQIFENDRTPTKISTKRTQRLDQ